MTLEGSNTGAGDQALIFPASFSQQQFWLFDQLAPGSPVNNVANGARLYGELNIDVLKQALGEMLRRHEALRTNILVQDGELVQAITSGVRLEVPFVDFSHMEPEAREREIERKLREEASRPFDLSKDLMYRAHLIRVQPAEHILGLTFHHISMDGWSLSLFCKELSVIYEALLTHQPLPPDPPLQYADYAVWQRDYMQGPVLDELLQFWKSQVTGAPPLLDLPLDFPRPKIQSYRGAKHNIVIPAPVVSELRRLSQREGSTLFMTLLAAFQTLLYRYSGRDDILVGAAVANRTESELEQLIGCFVNMLVLRGDLSGNPKFRELLRRVRKVTLDAYDHQQLPFERLVNIVQPARDPSYSPIFQVLFVLQNTPERQDNLGPMKMVTPEIDIGITKNDLCLYLWETGDTVSGWFEYATDLFTQATIDRLRMHYLNLLQAICRNPDLQLSEYAFLNPEEEHRLLVEFNQTEGPLSAAASVQEVIEKTAATSPGKIALVWNRETLTYEELNKRANRLAHHLRALGAKPEMLVAVFLNRSVDLVIALLAILKSGAAYVPLDPLYPKQRLEAILEDANPVLLLTQQELLDDLPPAKGKAICIDALDLQSQSGANPQSGVNSHNLAYVLFTSGSTGQPKGVAIEHRSVLALIEWARTVYSPDDLDGVLFSTSICFDVSVFEVFVTLSIGGKIILAENALGLPTLPQPDQVVFVNTVPSAMAELLRSNDVPRSVRIANLAGEALSQSLVEQIYKQTSVKKVHDLYGPTEDTVYSTFAVRRPGGHATIGRPIANSQAYVLDAHLKPTPLGVPGELCLAGAGLARGYWRRPELTAEKFVPNPFSSVPGAKLYKTGDLVRYLPDGSLEYLGRIDHQVKIRGFRIELGEIESVLRTCPGLTRAIVIARDDGEDGKRLVAYVETRQQPAPKASELRAHLKQKLPDYMVPSAFVVLSEFPTTPNGKIDRKALPKPDPIESERTLVPPRDALDQRLAGIWEKIFQKKPIGIQDNFFELGGHSLLAVRMFMEVEKATGKKLPLSTLLQAPTIEQLANILRQQGWEPPWLCLVPIKPSGTKPPFYCVHGVGGNVLEYLDLAKYMDKDQPFYGIQAIGLSGKHPWHKTVPEMAEHYIKEIRDFQPEGPYYIGGSSFGGLVAFEMAQRLRAMGQEVGLLAFFDTHAPGYPKFIPTHSALRNRLDHFSFRCALHWGNLKAAPGGEKLTYIWTKVKKFCYGRLVRWRRFKQRSKDRVEQLFWPKEIVQTREAGHQAHACYVPEKYPGNATLFRATGQLTGTIPHPTLGWSDFVSGQLEIYDTPGHHGSIVREPRARVLAQQLNESLRKSQSTLKSPTPSPETQSAISAAPPQSQTKKPLLNTR